jgi:CubicO group peptidase (beta-lactamase class C family)
MKKIFIFVFLPSYLFAQSLPDTTVRKIDSIFRAFKTGSPGCAVAVTKNGQVIFSKGYGMANLEYAVPIVPSTVFHIASESKQYVAFCMLLLEKQAKLSIDDDIRKYLDWVPDFGKKITIRHLIHHTSGLRDQWQLLANAGWQLDDVITQEHVIKLVKKQKALNFDPGEEHMYCNTGYTLMAEIVKKVSGLSLREYTDKNIFQPLGMNDTHFHDNYQELVPYRAYSYSPAGSGKWRHAVLSYSIVGATSLFTTVLDEAKWLRNYETGEVGGKELVEKMYQTGVLNDGRKLNYAFAIAIDKFKGWQQIGHGGGDAGFRTFACRYPEKGLGIVVFSNLGSVNPTGLARDVAGILIPDTRPEPETPAATKFADSMLMKRLQGEYYTERGDRLILLWRDGKLFNRNSSSGNTTEWPLEELEPGRYKITNPAAVLIPGNKNKASDSIMEIQVEMPATRLLFKRKPGGLPKQLSEFTGRYYNDETEAYYTVSLKDSVLMLDHRKFSSMPLRYFAPDQFNNSNWWMSNIRFLRNNKGKIVAFEVNSGRVQHLRYEKQ